MSIAEPRRLGGEHGDLADRILDAARRVVLRTGARKLSLAEVANLAGISRPTLYRYFASKEDLLDALGKREYQRFKASMADAVSGLSGQARIEAAIDVAATFLGDQPSRHLVDLEPGFVHDQMNQVLPMLTAALVGVFEQCVREDGYRFAPAPSDVAGAIARTAFSHYIFPDADPMSARRQLRAAAGLGDR
ncbi:MAG: helix-turn-helix domain-containing protein [Mycobacterium sp.]